MSERTLLLVDPFHSAKYLSECFAALDVRTIALYTVNMENIDRYLSPGSDYFDEQIVVGSRKVGEILSAIGAHTIDFVAYGDEGSVDVADRIGSILTPERCNDPATSHLRMDKFAMHEAVARHGLAHIRQQQIIAGEANLYDDAITDLDWPRFIKPLRGMASVGAAQLNNHAELVSYLNNAENEGIHGKLQTVTSADHPLAFVIGEYIDGQECFVDTFSYLGQHYISSIQCYHKVLLNGSPIYRYAEAVTDRAITDKLGNYVKSVLTSVGLNNGFAHTEVFIRDNGEPVLIEVNPRASGALGFLNRIAAVEKLLPQPALLKSVLFEHCRESTYAPPDRLHARLLFLSHFSNEPLPELESLLQRFSTVQIVHQIKNAGYAHAKPPYALFDLVAFVLCNSDDAGRLTEESEEILLQDLKGW
jgi:hypothetical protein